MPTDEKPALSVVVTVLTGAASLRRCLGHLMPQIEARPIEVIVAYESTHQSVDELRLGYPQVVFLDMGVVPTDARPGTQAAVHELHGRCTAGGLNAARGRLLALLVDFGAPRPDWCDQVLASHRLPYGVIGGAVEHTGRGTLNWAVYFQEFGRYQLPLREGPVSYVTDTNVSYKREVLESVRSLWAERYEEATVNWALAERGEVLWQRPQVVVCQDRGKLSFSESVAERYACGRAFGHARVREAKSIWRVLYIALAPVIPVVLLGRMGWKILSGRRNCGRFLLSLPHTVAMILSWSFGELVGHVSDREF